MSAPKCPQCHRQGTYNTKYEQCSACGLGYERQVAELVTERVTETPAVTDTRREPGHYSDTPPTNVPVVVTPNVTSNGGRHCPTCTCAPPKTGAERQKAYRKRKAKEVS